MKEYKNIGEAVEDYVTRRDNLRAWKKEVDEEEARQKQEMTEIESFLLSKADELGVDSFKTPYGTAYKSVKDHYRIGDWSTFVEYVKTTGNYQLFEKRVAKLAAKEIHQTDGELPAGLDYFSEYVIGVLRPTKKKSKEKSDD